MNLRRQLLLVSLLLLALPWAGCQFVTEMEGALQHGQEQALQSTTRAVATVLGDKPDLLYPSLQRWHDPADVKQQLYATASSAPIIVDGYDDGWDGPVHAKFGPVSYRARTRAGQLYLLLTVTDAQVRYHDPRLTDRASGDRLVLRMAGRRDYVIATAGPGPVQARYGNAGGYGMDGKLHAWESRIRGQWQDTLQGYSIELELPLSLTGGRLGFTVINVDTDAAGVETRQGFGNMPAGSNTDAPWLIYSPSQLQNLVTPFAGSDLRLLVLDKHHWVVALAGDPDDEDDNGHGDNTTPWLLKAVYRAILNGTPLRDFPAAPMYGQQVGPEISQAMNGQSAAGWYAQGGARPHKLLAAASPIFSDGDVVGVVMAQQNSEQYLSLTDRAFNRLLLYSLAAMAVSALGLLGYASWLSWRIRRLSAATSRVIAADGSIRADFPVSSSTDELGELSRRYAELLGRLREYTDYLRSLSRKLSHELRTPIAVIQSSLDNLEHEYGGVYQDRAREGLQRLNNILTAMSEASRLEESVHNTAMEEFDLVQLCRDMVTAYQGVYQQHRLEFDCELHSYCMRGAPDLVVQLLDKLYDNAAGFTPPGGRISLCLAPSRVAGKQGSATGVQLSLSNEGPPLPATMQAQLFESMVSLRQQDQQGHLGLGLHIVRLITEFHGGTVSAENLADGSGVRFVVEL